MFPATSAPVALAELELAFNSEGVPYSSAYGDVYHSSEGGPAQSRHVFLQGTQLERRWKDRALHTVLETGFGLGLNFLETWRAFEADAQAPQRLHFISVEKHPFARNALQAAHARWPEHRERSRALLAAWPLPLAGFHRLHLGERVTLTLLLGDAAHLLPQLEARVDSFFLDGFAPARNPELWTSGIFSQLARLAAPSAYLATWSVAASVRQGLSDAGFRLEKRPGFAAKRDMLTGEIAKPVAAQRSAGSTPERRALIIGAGIAGSACAHRLATRGWEVQVLERHGAPALEASGNPLGFIAPMVNIADALNAQLSRAAFTYAQRHYQDLGDAVIQARGLLRVLRDAREADRFARVLEDQHIPASLARFADVAEASRLAGWPTAKAGLWFEQGLAVDPSAACRAQLRHAGVDVRFHCAVACLREAAGEWEALDAQGAVLSRAPTLVIAAALQCLQWLPELRLESVRGQISLAPAPAGRRLNIPVTGDGHAAPLSDGRLLLGATFQPLDLEAGIREEDHLSNYARAEAMLPGLCADIDLQSLQGRVGFRTVTPDRLPLFGPPDGRRGLYVAAGLGARGLLWAPLAAEWLASRIGGEPSPLPRDMSEALLPQRFASRPPGH